jgi:hypothetical protein
MISVYSGLMGGGKTLWLMHAIRAALESGEWTVVTNAPIVLTKFREHLRERGKANAWLQLRWKLRLLKDEEVFEFWRYRGCVPVYGRNGNLTHWRWITLPERADVNDKSKIRLTTLDWAESRLGGKVLFAIDEASQFFRAKNWQQLGVDASYYASQHRGLGDEVILIAQSVENLDAQFRRLIQKFIYLTNNRYLKFWLIFKRPNRFTWSAYLKPYTGTEREKATEFGWFSLDKRLADCYDTSVKVGIPGHGEPETPPERTGLPWWMVPLGIIGVLLLFVGMARYFYIRFTHPEKRIVAIKKVVETQASNVVQVVRQEQPQPELREDRSERPKRAVWVTGFVYDGRLAMVWLSDGRSFRSGDGHLQRVSDQDVWIDSVSYPRYQPMSDIRSDPVPALVPAPRLGPQVIQGRARRGPYTVGGNGPAW